MNPVADPISEPAVTPGRRRIPWVMLVTIATLICVGVMFWMEHKGDGTDYQYYGQWIGSNAPDFTLTNQNGQPTRLSDLRGNAVLMTFGFTHCPNVCPTTLANIAGILRGLPARDQQRVKVLFISVDPQRDTPKALKDYVGFYSSAISGLTGSPDAIAKVAKDYGAYYEAQPQQSQIAGDYYTVTHSDYVYLIDPAGRYAVLYNNDKLLDHAKMQADLKHVLAGDPGK